MGTQNSHADHVYLNNIILMGCCSYSLNQCILYTTSLHMEFEKRSGKSKAPAAPCERQRPVSANSLVTPHCFTPQPATHARGNLHTHPAPLSFATEFAP